MQGCHPGPRVGVIALLAAVVLLALVAPTVVGIPLVVGALVFALSPWVALVYGRFAVGTWLLSLAEVDSRWAALLVGLAVLGLAARLPWVGGAVDAVVVLLGLGAMALVGYTSYRGRRA